MDLLHRSFSQWAECISCTLINYLKRVECLYKPISDAWVSVQASFTDWFFFFFFLNLGTEKLLDASKSGWQILQRVLEMVQILDASLHPRRNLHQNDRGEMWHKEQGKEEGWAGCWGLAAQHGTGFLSRDFSLGRTWINSWAGWMNIRGVLGALVKSLCVGLIQCLLQKKAIAWG